MRHDVSTGRRWMLWSQERGAWWKANRHGYTADPSEALRISEDEARDMVERIGLDEHGRPGEVAMLEPTGAAPALPNRATLTALVEQLDRQADLGALTPGLTEFRLYLGDVTGMPWSRPKDPDAIERVRRLCEEKMMASDGGKLEDTDSLWPSVILAALGVEARACGKPTTRGRHGETVTEPRPCAEILGHDEACEFAQRPAS